MFVSIFHLDMNLEQETTISTQTARSNFDVIFPFTSSAPLTSSVCDSIILLPCSTQRRTTAAIIPSLVVPGVDVVIYEKVNDLQI